MSRKIEVYVSDDTEIYLAHAAKASAREMEDLAESAIENVSLEYAKSQDIVIPKPRSSYANGN